MRSKDLDNIDLSPHCFLKIEYVIEGEKVFSVLLLILANPKTHMLASNAWKIFLITPKFKNTLFDHQVCVYLCILILQHTCGHNSHKDSFIKIREIEENADAETQLQSSIN